MPAWLQAAFCRFGLGDSLGQWCLNASTALAYPCSVRSSSQLPDAH